MNRGRFSTQVFLYFLMMMFLMFVIGCGSSDNETPAPATTAQAQGTYTWNSGTDVLTFHWTSTTFSCNGPTKLGSETMTGVTVTATTMTWSYNNWTRSSGTADSPAGTWTQTDAYSGNTYTLVFTPTSSTSGTVSVSAPIIACASRDYNPGVSTTYVPDGSINKYSVWMWYDDNPKTASAVSVTGHGITGSMALTYRTTDGSWNPSDSVNFGTTLPTGLPWTYTFNIDSTTKTVKVSCFLTTAPTSLAPSGTIATLTPTFSWTGISANDAIYNVQVQDSSYNTIWSKNNVSVTSVLYDGPALASGTSYNFNLCAYSRSTCPDGNSCTGTTFTTP
jgi:hypothetical protein